MNSRLISTLSLSRRAARGGNLPARATAPAHRLLDPKGHTALETSDVANLSSSDRSNVFGVSCRGVREGLDRIVGLSGRQAVAQLVQHSVEQVPQRGRVAVTALVPAQVVLTRW